MKSVTSKPTTLRRATATARLRANAETIVRMKANDLPKKDVLIVARVAAMTAAKRTSDLIPDCHPLPIDSVEVDVGQLAARNLASCHPARLLLDRSKGDVLGIVR